MKKYLIMAAVAMLGFASCTNDEDQSEPQEINFSAFNYKPTRAPITTTTYGTSAPAFGVFAARVVEGQTDRAYATNYANSELYMNGVMIDYDQINYKIWRPKSGENFITYYWPLSGSLTFVGYTPYTVSAGFAPKTRIFTISDYVATTSVEYQSDVMYSKIADGLDKSFNDQIQPYTEGGGSKTGINILFNHALSQIVFSANTDKEYSDASFKIDYIKVIDILKEGDLSVINDAPASGTGIVDGWTASLKETFTPVTSTENLSDEGTIYGNALLMIPQNISDDVKVEIKYTMTPVNGLASSKVVTIQLNDVAKINLPVIHAGKRYVINLTVSANEILFAPSIATDWESTAITVQQPNQNI